MTRQFEGSLKWERIYYLTEISNTYIGYGEETWRAETADTVLYRHVRYNLNEGDESNRIETMVSVTKRIKTYHYDCSRE